MPCTVGAAPAVLQDDLQGELLGIASPLSIYYLGIGPYIDASWTISLIMLTQSPPGMNKHLQSLRRAGREVCSDPCTPLLFPSTPALIPVLLNEADDWKRSWLQVYRVHPCCGCASPTTCRSRART